MPQLVGVVLQLVGVMLQLVGVMLQLVGVVLQLVGVVRRLRGRACVGIGLWDGRRCRDRNLDMSGRDKGTGREILVKSLC
jgi:hypothetical protein